MRAVLQRVDGASVRVGDETVASIQKGILVLLGVAEGDGREDIEYLARKIAGLRIFEDEAGKMNLSILDVGGSVLAVSQFTLVGDTRKGRRPSFTAAASPELAEPLYMQFCELLRNEGIIVKQGRFGAHMRVELVNDGPVTLWLDTAALAGN